MGRGPMNPGGTTVKYEVDVGEMYLYEMKLGVFLKINRMRTSAFFFHDGGAELEFPALETEWLLCRK